MCVAGRVDSLPSSISQGPVAGGVLLMQGQEQAVLGVTGGFIGAGVANDAKGLSQELGGAWVVGVGALPGEGLCGEVDRGFRNAAKGGYFLRGLGPIRRCEKEWIGNVRMCE